jgi:hypothetical protein
MPSRIPRLLKLRYLFVPVQAIGRSGGEIVIKKLGLIAIAVLAVGMWGIGCGGGGDDGGSSTTVVAVTENPSLTAAQFGQRAEAICYDGKEQIVLDLKNRAEDLKVGSLQEIPGSEPAEVMAASLTNQLEKIQELGAPPKEVAKVEALADAFQRVIDELEAEKPEGTAEIQPILGKLDKAANAVEAHGCAYGE